MQDNGTSINQVNAQHVELLLLVQAGKRTYSFICSFFARNIDNVETTGANISHSNPYTHIFS